MPVLYANRYERAVIFDDPLRELVDKYPDRLTVMHWLDSLQGLPSAGETSCYLHRPAFICGPEPYMQTVRDALAMLKTNFPASAHQSSQSLWIQTRSQRLKLRTLPTSHSLTRWCS